MRRLTFDEGNGTVDVQHRRATVRHGGRYLGQGHLRRGRWSVPGHADSFRSPLELAEALADTVVAA